MQELTVQKNPHTPHFSSSGLEIRALTLPLWSVTCFSDCT